MADYINREELKRKLIDEKNFFPVIVARALDEISVADVVPRREGKWKFTSDTYAECTECEFVFEALPCKMAFILNNQFCRHCGAKMKGGAE